MSEDTKTVTTLSKAEALWTEDIDIIDEEDQKKKKKKIYNNNNSNSKMADNREEEEEESLAVDKNSICFHIAKNFVKYHCTFCFLFTVLIFGVSAIALSVDGGMGLSERTNNDLTVNTHKASILNDALDNAKSLTDPADSSTKKKVKERESAEMSRGSISIMWNSKDGGDIFTPTNLKEMCVTEKLFFDHKDYEDYCVLNYNANGNATGCKPPTLSTTYMFYGASFQKCETSMKMTIPGAGSLPICSVMAMQGKNTCNPTTICDFMADQIPTAIKVKDPKDELYVVNSLIKEDFNFTKCDSLETWKVNAVREWLYKTLKLKEVNLGGNKMTGEQLLGFYLDVDTLNRDPTKSPRARSLLSIGSPLKGFKDAKDDEEAQKKLYNEYFMPLEQDLFKKFGMEKRMFFSQYRTKAETDTMDVEWFAWAMMSKEFSRILGEDFLAPIASIGVVITWILIHTGSVFVGGLGMLQILLSIPFSFAFYKFVLGIPFFSQMHILTIFLVLGVGADDVFVLNDAWKQSKTAVHRAASDSKMDFLTNRMFYAYKRTASAVFNTSFTTAMAFVSTGISPMMSISTFGWFASVCICVNYLFVITFTPCVILIHHLYIIPCFNKMIGRKPKEEDEEEGSSKPVAEEVDAVGKLFGKYYAPLLLKTLEKGNNKINNEEDEETGNTTPRGNDGASSWKQKIKPCSLILVLIFLGYGIQAVYFMVQLTPPTKAEAWFPPDHMITGLTDRMTDNYMGGSDNSYVVMSFVVGITGADREASGFDIYKPDDNRGLATFDDKFDLYPEANQIAFQNLCDYVDNFKCEDSNGKWLDGCLDQTNHKLVRGGTLVCFITEFRDWHKGTYGNTPSEKDGVTKPEFLTRIKEFRETTKPGNETSKSWKTTIGFIDGKFKYARIPFTSSMARLNPVLKKEPVYELLEKSVEEQIEKMPEGLKSIFQESGYYGWVWMVTQRQLVTSMMEGMAICFPVAFVVLMVATNNIIISSFATLSIGFIVSSVLGFTKAVMGWDLGIAESIAGIIVIGFSVDYVVHLAHMYMDGFHVGGFSDRDSRISYALEKMGGTVFAGAVTTAGSGAVMWICQLTFFTKMAVLITMTILFSLFYSTLFFIPLCALIGPNGTFGDIIKMGHGKKGNIVSPRSITVKPKKGRQEGEKDDAKNYRLPVLDESKNYKLPEKATV